jgi:ubiquinone/menaquinone biosynthesis C-methylase UbiE
MSINPKIMAKKDTAQQYWNVRSELFANYYNKPSLFDKTFRKGVYTRMAVAQKVINEFKEPTVLDIGSGPGVNSVTWLRNSDASFLTGIDFAENMNDYAREFAAQNGVADRCEFINGDFTTYDFKGKTFDVSIAVGVFDYVDDSLTFLKKMATVTNKAAMISWPKDGLRMALRRYRYTCPVYHYTLEEIKEMHREAGFKDFELGSVSKGGWTTIGRK